jgi:exopolysaccharide biosynthesis protein
MHSKYLEPLSLWTVSLETNKPSLMVNLTKNIDKEKENSKLAQNRFNKITDPTIKIEDFQTNTYSSKIMLISDPKRIRVGITKFQGDVGQTVSEMVSENHAVAGINGGGFSDNGYRGTGGIPTGTTIHNGQFLTTGGTEPMIGFTREGLLVVGNYEPQELKDLHITEALTFGPVLVKDGEGVVIGDGGWSYAPRTAIGQREDGTVIMIVTDGRYVHGLNNVGASMRDLMNLMLKYGAVNAANLDGGSSTTMVKDSRLVNEPTDVLGERKIATSFLVMPE